MQIVPVVLFLSQILSSQAPTGGVSGTVVDARGGEVLANVEISVNPGLTRMLSDAAGHFHLDGLAPGYYSLSAATVGYHVAKYSAHVDAGVITELSVVLSPETFHQTVTVEARADPFEPSHADSPGALVLGGNDMKNLGSVIADDPLRSVQSLPGVSSDNDFDARFSLRGADFSRIGLYLDDVLLHQPFHMIQGQAVSGTGSAFDGDLMDTMELNEGAFPARFGDRSAGVLDVATREGSRSQTMFRVSVSATEAGLLAEGPLGKHGSWLAIVRKSYLQYLLARTFPDATLIFGVEDAQARLSYDLTPRSNVSLYLLESFSNLNRAQVGSTLGVDSVLDAGYHYTLGNAGWRYTPHDRMMVTSHLAWMREKYNDENPSELPLSAGYYTEWAWNTNASWMWAKNSTLQAGWSMRQVREDGFSNQYFTDVTGPWTFDRFGGSALREGGYGQQSWTGWKGRLHLTAGARWDYHSIDKIAAVSPSGSVSLGLTRSTNLLLAGGQYTQYPEISVLTSILGSHALPPLRSNQFTAGIEQRVGPRTRIRAEVYERADRDMPFQPWYDPRVLANGTLFQPPVSPLYTTSLRGNGRGAEVFVQHSSANRLTGWVSYAYGHTVNRDGVTGDRFPADLDQRHTVNVYAGYRIRSSINLSVHSNYGSGFPIPGYLVEIGGLYYLGSSRNQLRFHAYTRTDARINKAWTHEKWKLTLYGEVINLTNRSNFVFESFDGYNLTTRQAWFTVDKMFPILPSVGMTFER
jgi:hypothetical protein